jgi:hypothetical protein
MSTDKFAALIGDFDLEWTSVDGHNRIPSGLENCLGCKAYVGSKSHLLRQLLLQRPTLLRTTMCAHLVETAVESELIE